MQDVSHTSAVAESTSSSLDPSDSGAETSLASPSDMIYPSISSSCSARTFPKIMNLSELETYSNCDNSNINTTINTTTDDSTNSKLLRVNDASPGNGITSYSTRSRSSTKTMIDSETGAQVEKHPDLWFEDGSVICRAENTLFCVHMSQLARHSSVFNDLFMLPQGTASEEPMALSRLSFDTQLAMGGHDHEPRRERRTVPLVYLYDAAEDVANLFTALYDGPSFGNNDEDDFRIVSGILRLSTKYLVDSLRVKALAHLTVAWPGTLKAWDAREDLGIRYPHPASVINLAREVDAPCLLPAAFYDMSRHSFAQIFEPNEDDPLYCTDQPPSLSPCDMQRLCLGKEASQQTITTLIQSLGNGRYPRLTEAALKGVSRTHLHGKQASLLGLVCVSVSVCRKDFAELRELATQHYVFDRESGCCDPLYVAEELGELKSAEFSECKACANALESWACKEREKMWKMIPYWFRLVV